MEDFSSYDLIIDARSEREYEEDHIPGAINLPVVKNDEYAEVGTTCWRAKNIDQLRALNIDQAFYCVANYTTVDKSTRL